MLLTERVPDLVSSHAARRPHDALVSANDAERPRRLPDPLPENPLPLVAEWLEEARQADRFRNPDAMALATCDAAGRPHVRMVLCRGFDAARGGFRFYTNRNSPKGEQLDASGRASAVFYWDGWGRQLRIEGPVARTSDADSDRYFASRHPLSQVSAWASEQSRPIASRAALVQRHEESARRFGVPDGREPVPRDGADPVPPDGAGPVPWDERQPVQRPPHWGGYEISANRIELWLEGDSRMHERAVFTREPGAPAGAAWRAERLQP